MSIHKIFRGLLVLLTLILLTASSATTPIEWISKADSIQPLDPFAAYKLYIQHSPSDHRRIARSLLALGEIDRAIQYFESADDRLNLGRGYFLKGKREKAYEIFSGLKSPEANLLAGLCVENTNPLLALNHFHRAKEGLSIIADYVSLKIAYTLSELGRVREALSTLTKAIQKYPKLKEREDVIEELSRIYLMMGYPMLARKQLLSLLSMDYPRYKYSVAMIEKEMGWPTEEAFREILKNYPRTVWAVQSFDHLVQSGRVEIEDHLYGGIAYHSSLKNYEKAAELLNTFLNHSPKRERPVFELGMINYKMAKYEDADSLFSHVEGELEEDAIFYSARCKERMGKSEDAVSEYQKISAESPNYPRVQYYAGRLCERTERFDQAIRSYRDLRRRYPNDSFADDACFRTGFILYSLGKLREAVQEFREFTELYPQSPLLDGALYWMAKSMGKGAKKEILGRLVKVNPFGYYSNLASKNFQSELPELESRRNYLPFDSLPDHQLRRGFLLLELGLLSEAEREFSRVNPEHNHLLAIIYHQHAVTPKAISYAYRAGTNFLKILYPRTFIPTLEEVSPDPHLMLALMREESRFDPFAISRSGAIGVAQIMPATGEMIARELDYGDFNPENLFDVATNLRFGSFYLEKMRKRFGKLEYALAAYNAGPHRVEEWLSELDHNSLEEFVEKIPFSETRKYVKRVLASYWNYSRIYGESSGAVPTKGN